MPVTRGILVKASFLVGAMVLSSVETTAKANVVTFPDFSSWNSTVSGVSTVTIPDPDPDPFIYFGTGTASVTYGGVTFSTNARISDSSFYNIGMDFSGLPAVLSSQSASTGPENILVTFPVPVHGFALNYGTFDGSGVMFLLSNGDTFSQGSTGGSTYDVPDFAGATDAATTFASVLITSDDPTLDINGLAYATSLVSGASPVPEPGTLISASVGVMGLIVKRMISGARRSRRCRR